MIVPEFYLYGEPRRAVDQHFLHVERLDDRSRPEGWKIRAHAHADLAQLFLIETGGGQMFADGRTIRFDAPATLVVPRGVAHGFEWESESTGWVMTVACGYLDQLCTRFPALLRLFDEPAAIEQVDSSVQYAAGTLANLARELSWSAVGSTAAIEAGLLATLVQARRDHETKDDTGISQPGPAAALVARYRNRIEERFRERESVTLHAAALAVSPSTLRAACARVAAASPAAMLDARALLEAKRALLYSNLSVAQIGYAIGFSDPAYFSRFFSRHVRQSPSQFRHVRGHHEAI